MSKLYTSLVAALAFGGVATAQSTVDSPIKSAGDRAPIFAGTYFVATGQFVPAVGNASQLDGPGAAVVYNNNHYTGHFYDIQDGTRVTDEGRIPSTSSPSTVMPFSLTGTQDSYQISTIQMGYVTDSVGDVAARLTILDQYDTCTSPLMPGVIPDRVVFDVIISGMPGTVQTGSLTPYTFDIDMTGLEFCMAADGDGVYDNGTDDRFGWSLVMSGDMGSQTGPIVGSDPAFMAPVGDGTVFQNAGAPSGTGLGTEDQWHDIDPINGDNCFNWGGYDPVDGDPAFGSFWLVLGANMGYECTGCETGIDDGFENNDDCATAAPLAAPSTTVGLVADGADADFFRVTIPAYTSMTATALFSHAQADIDMRLFNDDCMTQLDGSGTTSDNEDVGYFNCSPMPIDVTVEVFVFGGSDCGDYDLDITLDTTCSVDDLLEDNDDCATAFPISLGLTPNLRISVCDEDYFSTTLDPGESVDISIFFTDAEMDLDLYLYPAGAATCGDRNGGEWLVRGFSASDDESISWTNTTGQVQDYVIKVEVFSAGSELCTGYALSYLEGRSTEVGINFCTAVPNSSGDGAHIFATGSDSISANDLVLGCEFLTGTGNGYFLVSQTQIFVPNPGGPGFASLGNLCIAGSPIGRYTNNIVNPGGGDTVTQVVDNTAIPQPSGMTAVLSGDTWNFQYYYRDGSDTNFSDALAVLFKP